MTKNNEQGYIGEILLTILALIVLFFVLCFRTVDAGQVGVVTRFGEVNREINSGIAVKLPWPFEKLYKLDTRTQKEEQDASAATSDLQDVNAKIALNYALSRGSAQEIFKSIGTEYKDRIVIPALQESFKASTAGFTASELLTKRPEVKEKALKVLKERLEPYGIRVDDLNVVNFSFSTEFTKSIEDKQVAAQEAEKAKFNLERAKLDAQSQEVQKQSLSSELLQKYAIDKWDGKMPQYTGGGAVFNIPLSK